MEDCGKMHSLKEVADMLGVGYMTIYKMARDEKIETIRVGKMYRISDKAIESYINENKR